MSTIDKVIFTVMSHGSPPSNNFDLPVSQLPGMVPEYGQSYVTLLKIPSQRSTRFSAVEMNFGNAQWWPPIANIPHISTYPKLN